MRKIFAFVLTLALVLGTMTMPSSAATKWPATSGIQTYCLSPYNDTVVYKTATSKTKYGTIYADDLVTIKGYDAASGRFIVTYPITGGTKTGYVDKNLITTGTVNSASGTFTATAKMDAYRRVGTTSKVGTVYKGDKCYKIATSGKYTQIIYPITSGYKLGWVLTSSIPSTSTSTSTSTTAATTMTNALYNINVSGSKITCGFDGYVNTKGRHEGIDFSYGSGKAVYSLTEGTVVNVVQGKAGSTSNGGSLSTIAVYNSSTNKTVIYLHTAPVSSLKVGSTVKKGTKIATESNRGASAVHTHVEVRNGKKTKAAVSVNDYTLDNPNPTSFWKSIGYTVK